MNVWAVVAAMMAVVSIVLAAMMLRGRRADRIVQASTDPDELDEAAFAALTAFGQPCMLLNARGRVLRYSASAETLGLVIRGQLTHVQARQLLTKALTSATAEEEELEFTRGPLRTSRRFATLRAARISDDRLVMLVNDRTEARRSAEIRQDFVVNVSHELKTPVGAILLLAETMADAAEDPEAVRRFANRTQEEADRLSELVRDIIELSRLQSAGASFVPMPVQVDDVIAEAVSRASGVAEGRSTSIVAPDNTGLVVLGDQALLVTAVRNLLDNAVVYSPPGSVVRVVVRNRDGLAAIQVIDTGIGIPREARERIFERFYRVDPARSRITGGTGLGLSIVKHIALDHGGDITVWSEPGNGSTFTLLLPLAGQPATIQEIAS